MSDLTPLGMPAKGVWRDIVGRRELGDSKITVDLACGHSTIVRVGVKTHDEADPAMITSREERFAKCSHSNARRWPTGEDEYEDCRDCAGRRKMNNGGDQQWFLPPLNLHFFAPPDPDRKVAVLYRKEGK